MSIDPNSPEFMFGQIIQRLHGLEQGQEKGNNELRSLTDAVTALPCGEQGQRIEALEKWKLITKSEASGKTQARIRLWFALLVAFFASGVTWLLGKLGS